MQQNSVLKTVDSTRTSAVSKYKADEIEHLLERWARWRQYRASGELGWARRDSLGKMMSGMPGTNCPQCHGLGTHKAKKNKNIRKDCDFCNGTGRIRMDNTSRANPALIRSTAPRYGYDDPESQRVDFIVCTDLSEDQRLVLIMAYTRSGTQTVHAQRLWIEHRLDISQQQFSRILSRAINIVAEKLES